MMNSAHKLNRPTRFRRGMSLIELVMSVTILTVVMGSVTGTLVVALRAVDTKDTPLGDTTNGTDALQLIEADLMTAVQLVEVEPSAFTIKVPDRDSPADGKEETIRYEWSGTDGDPLYVQYNDKEKYILVNNVYRFSLDQFTRDWKVDAVMHRVDPQPADYAWGYFEIDADTPPEVVDDEGAGKAAAEDEKAEEPSK